MKTFAFTIALPVIAIAAIAIWNPEALTWPIVLAAGLVAGVFGTLTARFFLDED